MQRRANISAVTYDDTYRMMRDLLGNVQALGPIWVVVCTSKEFAEDRVVSVISTRRGCQTYGFLTLLRQLCTCSNVKFNSPFGLDVPST
jgi:hypothetical protein